MKSEKFIAKAGLFYVLSIVLGVCVSWEYCGCELMCVTCYFLMRAMWHDITSDSTIRLRTRNRIY